MLLPCKNQQRRKEALTTLQGKTLILQELGCCYCSISFRKYHDEEKKTSLFTLIIKM